LLIKSNAPRSQEFYGGFVKTKSTQAQAIDNMDSAMVRQNILDKLSIDYKEFEAMLQLLWGKFDNDHPKDMCPKIMNPKVLLSKGFLKGVHEVKNIGMNIPNNERIYPEEESSCIGWSFRDWFESKHFTVPWTKHQ